MKQINFRRAFEFIQPNKGVVAILSEWAYHRRRVRGK